METIRNIATIPRLILNDFKVVGISILDFCASFARGYVAFFFEIVHDFKVTFLPYFDRSLYRSVAHDLVFVLQGIVSGIRTFFTLNSTTVRDTLSSHTKVTAEVLKEKISFTPASIHTLSAFSTIDTSHFGPVRTFFAKYRALLTDIYNEVAVAMEETDEIPMYLIAASILVFILGCVWFYIIMVFLV